MGSRGNAPAARLSAQAVEGRRGSGEQPTVLALHPAVGQLDDLVVTTPVRTTSIPIGALAARVLVNARELLQIPCSRHRQPVENLRAGPPISHNEFNAILARQIVSGGAFSVEIRYTIADPMFKDIFNVRGCCLPGAVGARLG